MILREPASRLSRCRDDPVAPMNLFLSIGATVLSLLTSGGQPKLPALNAPPSLLKQVSAYRQIVERYRRGETDAVDAVIAIPAKDLESIVNLIFGVPGMPWAPAGDLPAGAVLHADAALRIVGFTKGANEQRWQHLTAARRMLHASGPPGDPFISRWYLAVSRAFRERQWLRVAEELLERGRAEAPGNPIVLYESATVAEILARGYLMTPPAARAVFHSIESDSARSALQRAGMLNDAAGWLREALERDNTMLMARLHLGRVETLRGNEQDGLVHLERVVGATADPATAYLAALFSGAAHERLRNTAAAEASYRQAIARFPVGQAAYVALSEVLQRSGRAAESRTVLQSLLDAKAESVREPWWWYLVEPPGVAEERLNELRRGVRQ